MGTRFLGALAPNERKAIESSIPSPLNPNRKPVPVREVLSLPPAQPRVVIFPVATGDCCIGM